MENRVPSCDATAPIGRAYRMRTANRIVAIDFETTGMGTPGAAEAAVPGAPGRVVEIGCAALERRGDAWTWGGGFHAYVNPRTFITKEASRIHGITRRTILKAPQFKSVAGALKDYVGGSILVAHDYANERDLLTYESVRAGLIAADHNGHPARRWICSQAAFSAQFPGSGRTSLDKACDALGIDRSHRVRHDAVTDAALALAVTAALCGIAIQGEPPKAALRTAA